MTDIEIVDYDRLTTAISKAPSSAAGAEGFEDWKRFHDGLVQVLQRHGTVGSDPLVSWDLYHSRDWFNAQIDSFVVVTTKAITEDCLLELNQVIAEEYPDCSVVLEGIDDVMNLSNLEIFVSASEILVGWNDESEFGCMLKLAELDIQF